MICVSVGFALHYIARSHRAVYSTYVITGSLPPFCKLKYRKMSGHIHRDRYGSAEFISFL